MEPWSKNSLQVILLEIKSFMAFCPASGRPKRSMRSFVETAEPDDFSPSNIQELNGEIERDEDGTDRP